MANTEDLLSIADAAKRTGVSRNTMLLAAKNNKVRSTRIGRYWYIYASDLERWKQEEYRPQMAARYPIKKQDDDNTST